MFGFSDICSRAPNAGRLLTTLSASASMCAVLASASQALAQTASGGTGPYMLPDVVVTASRFDQPLSEVGSAISVITADEIERAQLTDLNQVLARLPGVSIGPDTAGGPQGVSIRGLGPRNTLFLVDGVEIADVSEAQVQYTLRRQIDVQDIERIEVLRGPQSSLYGADTSGGVINIITKKASKKLGGSAYAEGGSFGYARTGGSVEFMEGPIDGRISGFYYSEDGYSTAADGLEDDSQGSEGARLSLGYDATENLRLTAGGSVSQINNHYDTVSGIYDSSFNRIGNTAGEERNNVTKMEYSARLGMEHSSFGGRLNGQLDYGFTRNERDIAYFNPSSDPDAYIDSYNGTKHKFGYTGNVRLAPKHQLIGGLETEYTTLEQDTPAVSPTPIVKEDTRNDAVFLGYAGTLIEGLTINLSGRLDNDADFGTEFTYRTSAAYLVSSTGTKFRGSYGTGFVAPSLYERFDPCIGNADIQPETSEGFDVGVDQTLFGGKMRAGATLFHVETEDQIDYRSLTTPQNPACNYAGTYVNEDQTRSQGIELEVAGDITPSITVTAAYTFTDAENLADGSKLRNLPRHRAAGDLSWRVIDKAMVGMGMEYRSEVITYTDIGDDRGDEYVVLSARAAYDITPTVTAYARAENVLDTDYEEQPGYTTPGLAAYAGLRVRF